ncbi:MAG: hypothetical protein C4332_09135 [Meiothermus sp.]
MAPVSSGGALELVANAVRDSLKVEELADASVYNFPGDSATKRLTEFVTKYRGDRSQLLVMGLTVVGGVVSYKPSVSLGDVTPIARLSATQAQATKTML